MILLNLSPKSDEYFLEILKLPSTILQESWRHVSSSLHLPISEFRWIRHSPPPPLQCVCPSPSIASHSPPPPLQCVCPSPFQSITKLYQYNLYTNIFLKSGLCIISFPFRFVYYYNYISYCLCSIALFWFVRPLGGYLLCFRGWALRGTCCFDWAEWNT